MKTFQLVIFLIAFALSNAFATAQQTPTFHGNAQRMLNEVCNASPFFIRSIVRNKILKELSAVGVDISEDDLIRATIQATPEKFQEKTMNILNRFKS